MDTLSARRQAPGRAAHIGAFHKYCYWRAEIRVSHAEVIRFSASLPPSSRSSHSSRSGKSFLFHPCSPVLRRRGYHHHHRRRRRRSSSPLYRAPHFSFSLSLGPSDPLSRFRGAFSLPSPAAGAARHTALLRSLVPLFFAPWKSFVPTADVQPFVEDDRTKKGA